MKSIYYLGKLRVIVKNKYAYHYNPAGSIIGKAEFENRNDYIDQLYAAGATRDEKDYQASLKRLKI